MFEQINIISTQIATPILDYNVIKRLADDAGKGEAILRTYRSKTHLGPHSAQSRASKPNYTISALTCSFSTSCARKPSAKVGTASRYYEKAWKNHSSKTASHGKKKKRYTNSSMQSTNAA